ncbi:MAG: hypothetical protein AAGC93_16165 [Cyanobacteria bacterium P01_F01_bin.53]
MVIVHQQSLAPIEYFTKDPATIAHHPEYYGSLSNIGVLLWNASAVVCFLGALQLRILGKNWLEKERLGKNFDNINAKYRNASYFLMGFGLLSTVLCLDDLFLLHESIIFNKFGLPEEAAFLAYAIALIFLLVRFRKILLKRSPIALGASLVLFAASIGTDKLPPSALVSEQDLYLIEDGMKLLAIFLWLSYFAWVTLELMLDSLKLGKPSSLE